MGRKEGRLAGEEGSLKGRKAGQKKGSSSPWRCRSGGTEGRALCLWLCRASVSPGSSCQEALMQADSPSSLLSCAANYIALFRPPKPGSNQGNIVATSSLRSQRAPAGYFLKGFCLSFLPLFLRGNLPFLGKVTGMQGFAHGAHLGVPWDSLPRL